MHSYLHDVFTQALQVLGNSPKKFLTMLPYVKWALMGAAGFEDLWETGFYRILLRTSGLGLNFKISTPLSLRPFMETGDLLWPLLISQEWDEANISQLPKTPQSCMVLPLTSHQDKETARSCIQNSYSLIPSSPGHPWAWRQVRWEHEQSDGQEPVMTLLGTPGGQVEISPADWAQNSLSCASCTPRTTRTTQTCKYWVWAAALSLWKGGRKSLAKSRGGKQRGKEGLETLLPSVALQEMPILCRLSWMSLEEQWILSTLNPNRHGRCPFCSKQIYASPWEVHQTISMRTDKSGQPSGMRAKSSPPVRHQNQVKKPHEGSNVFHSQPLVPHQAASPVPEVETGKGECPIPTQQRKLGGRCWDSAGGA